MRLGSCLIPATLLAGFGLLTLSPSVLAQEAGSGRTEVAVAELPEAPQPQLATDTGQQTGQNPSTEPVAPSAAPAQGSSSSQTAAGQSDAEKSQHQKADEQIKEQEKQRVLGILPAFNTTYRSDAVSLTAGQKMKLAFRSATDPVAFAAAFVVAGYHEAMDDDVGFPWGIKGYGERSGAAYLDAFDGGMIGNGILPSILHQDPRYFRLGHGGVGRRLGYSLLTVVRCLGDNGKWQFNASGIVGTFAGGAISNTYYPSADRGLGLTLQRGSIDIGESLLQSLASEFYPGISRALFHRHPKPAPAPVP